MIVLSAGMQKAGTGWYFNLTNDLLIVTGHQDVRVIRDRYNLKDILKYHNCNLSSLSSRNLLRLCVPHLLRNTFVVKTHEAPSRSIPYFMAAGIIKTTYIYRDPRDVVVSAFEHGQRIREAGERHTFGELAEIEDAILFTKQLLANWNLWMQIKGVLAVRYEELLIAPVKILEQLADFLALRVERSELEKVAVGYQGDQLDETKKDYLHFNQAAIGRFREVLSARQQALCQEHFGSYLEKMGYEN